MTVSEHTQGTTKFLVIDVIKANTRDYKAGVDMESKTKTKTLSIDLDASKLTADELELLKAYGVALYTPKPTSDNPNPSDFILIKFSGKTPVYELEGKTKRFVTFDASQPNFQVEDAQVAVTRNKSDNKQFNDYTRISALRVKASKMTVFAVDFFGDDDAFTPVLDGEIEDATKKIDGVTQDVTPIETQDVTPISTTNVAPTQS